MKENACANEVIMLAYAATTQKVMIQEIINYKSITMKIPKCIFVFHLIRA
ncbi:MAG: hypothetical protein O7D30_12315 [Rickettsia endosymbiont of Ixodes persulcatus]|nr:hypothetical protein [Rickettsia endosymbiont of Ixodes persulcatus]